MFRPSIFLKFITIILIASNLLACGKKAADNTDQKSQSTIISATLSSVQSLEIREESLGTLEGLVDPTIAAEVAGKITRVLAHPGKTVNKGDVLAYIDATDYNLQSTEAVAEVSRLEALIANQSRIVDRNQKLVQKNFISQHALEDVTTQQIALQQQLDGAKARAEIVSRARNKTKLISPVDGVVQKQIVSAGDYVKVGDPLLQIIGKQKLRAHLPLPEGIAAQLHPGLKVRLSTPTSITEVISEIREFKPLISETSRAIDVIADVNQQSGWQPGASVKGEIILGQHSKAVVVPEESVVLRPAGEVVYVIKNNIAVQQLVKTGLRQDGMVEILEGLNAGAMVATDGAAFLSHQAKVTVNVQKNVVMDKSQ
jgi:membrane fusion protein (multidrug efflux system)